MITKTGDDTASLQEMLARIPGGKTALVLVFDEGGVLISLGSNEFPTALTEAFLEQANRLLGEISQGKGLHS